MDIQNTCEHEWIKLTEADNERPSIYKCTKCRSRMYASELFQYEALKNQIHSLDNQTKLAQHQLGFQKWLSLAAFIVSALSLIIAALVVYFK